MRLIYQYWNILDKNYKKFFILIIFLSFISMLLETIGVSLVIPIISLLLQEKQIFTDFLNLIGITFFDNLNNNELLIAVLIILLFFFIFKFFYLITLSYFQATFTYNLVSNLSYRLYEIYLNKPYSFHINKNSSELIRNIVPEMSNFRDYIITPINVIITEGLVIFGILILLLLYDPLAFIIISFSAIIFFIIYLTFTKKVLKTFGTKRLESDELRIKNVQEGLAGIKEIKIFQKEKNILDLFSISNFKSAFAGRIHQTFEQIPRISIELFALIGLILFLFFIIINGHEINTAFIRLSFLGIILFKLLPSINRLLFSMQNLRYGEPIFQSILEHQKEIIKIDNFPNFKIDNNENFHFNSLELKNIKFKYEYSNQYILNSINLKINKNDIIGIFGKSGEGKTTLINIILGLIEPQNGKVFLNNSEEKYKSGLWKKIISYVPQNVFISNASLSENIALNFNKNKDQKLIDEVIKISKLDEFKASLNNNLNQKIGEMGSKISGGQRQRIGIARALYKRSEFIVFDESTSSLDSNTEKQIIKDIFEIAKGKTIIIVTHKLALLKNCNKIYEIKNGNLINTNL